jgi:hypothetical protein
MAYCLISDDVDGDVFVADQVKTSYACEDGSVKFHASNQLLNVKTMISILENGSLTCIGKKRNGVIDVVWFFYDINCINILKKFNFKQTFNPKLHLVKKSYNEFTNAMNDPMFRFDVGESSKECNRLLEHKLKFIKIGIKYSLIFLNEDDSQIPGESNRIEQKSMNMTRTACKKINVSVERKHENSYSVVDFIVNKRVSVQDKAIGLNKAVGQKFCIRRGGGLPYNPDDIDIFQVSDLINSIIYAIPMRVMTNGIITSFFTTEQLMKTTVKFGPKWKEDHKQFKHDFKNSESALSYVKACETANAITQLTDREFYTNMIKENKDKFGSRKQLKEQKTSDE